MAKMKNKLAQENSELKKILGNITLHLLSIVNIMKEYDDTKDVIKWMRTYEGDKMAKTVDDLYKEYKKYKNERESK